MIKKEYTESGIKLTHPSGVITITTLENMRRHTEHIQTRIKKEEEMIQQISRDMSSLINAGAS